MVLQVATLIRVVRFHRARRQATIPSRHGTKKMTSMTTTAQCERIHALSADLTSGIMSITGSHTGCSDRSVRTELDAAISHLNAAYRAALLATCEV